MTRRLYFCTVLLLAAVGGLVAVVCNHRALSILDRRSLSPGVVDNTATAKEGRDGIAVIASRDLSRPAKVDVVIAQLEADATQAGTSDSLMVADVGNRQTVLLPKPPSSKTGGDQSDAENVDTLLEPTHTVAAVPMHEEALAAVSVQLASFSLSGRSQGAHAVLLPAIIERPDRARGRTPIVDLANQLIVPGERERTPVFQATLIPAPLQVTNDSMCDWSLTDETPVMDPSLLLSEMPSNEALRSVVEQWSPGEKSNAATSRRASPEALADMTRQTNLSWQQLYEIGRLSSLLDSESQQKLFWQAAVGRAAESPGLLSQGDRDLRSMKILAGTWIRLWRDDASAAEALAILLRWEPPHTRRLFQVTVLYMNALDRLGDKREGDMIERLTDLASHSPYLSVSDRVEARCVIGRALFRQRRFGEGFALLAAPLIQRIWEQ